MNLSPWSCLPVLVHWSLLTGFTINTALLLHKSAWLENSLILMIVPLDSTWCYPTDFYAVTSYL